MHVAISALFLPLLALATPAPAENPEQDNQKEQAQPEEAKKICKYVTEGAGSRRKKRMCLSSQEWIDWNRGE